MKQSKTAEYAYLAGMMDADGCFQIKRFTQSGRVQYDCAVLTNQVDGGAIDFLYGVFGGAVYRLSGYNQNPRANPVVYRWQVTRQVAADVAKRAAPFLRIKKKQAELLIRFRDIQKHQMRKPRGRGHPLEPYEIALREECYQEMKRLKKFIVPSAAVTTKCGDSSETMGSDSLALEEKEL